MSAYWVGRADVSNLGTSDASGASGGRGMGGAAGGFAEALYARLMGIDRRKLVTATPGAPATSGGGPQGALGAHTRSAGAPSSVEASSPRLRDVLYYAYHKGFWQLLRGLTFRAKLRACGGRFFLGRQTKILFPDYLSVGRNVAIGDYVYLMCIGTRGVHLGDNVRIREFGWVQVTSHLTNQGEGLVIGHDTYVGPHSILGAGGLIRIGNNVTLGAYVQLLAENHSFSDPNLPVNEQGVSRKGITIGDGSWLGNSVIVLDGVTVGERAVIGAGSVVTRDVPDGAVAVGNPARVLRTRE
jgi:acetyltransferase-like isoleucine patch superfamily enzyme